MKAIARLNHKSIIHPYNYGEVEVDEGFTLPYIVMPLYKDGSLHAWLQKNRQGKECGGAAAAQRSSNEER